MRACLATGREDGRSAPPAGTTSLPDMRALAERKGAGLLYGTNFSIGVQVMLQLAAKMGAAAEERRLHLRHRRDAPRVQARRALRHRDHPGRGGRAGRRHQPRFLSLPTARAMRQASHVLTANSDADRDRAAHESFSRRGFAEGAVRAAEWLSTRTGRATTFSDVYDFQDALGKDLNARDRVRKRGCYGNSRDGSANYFAELLCAHL